MSGNPAINATIGWDLLAGCNGRWRRVYGVDTGSATETVSTFAWARFSAHSLKVDGRPASSRSASAGGHPFSRMQRARTSPAVPKSEPGTRANLDLQIRKRNDRQAIRDLRQVGAGRRSSAMDAAAPAHEQGSARLAFGLVRGLDQGCPRPLHARVGMSPSRRRAAAGRAAINLRRMGQ